MDISSNLDAISEDQEADLDSDFPSSSAISTQPRINTPTTSSENSSCSNSDSEDTSSSSGDDDNSISQPNNNHGHSDEDHDMETDSSSTSRSGRNSKKNSSSRNRSLRNRRASINGVSDDDEEDDDHDEESEQSSTDESEEEADQHEHQNGNLDIPKGKNGSNPRQKKKRSSSLSTSPSDPSKLISATPTKKITKKSKKSVKSKSSKGSLNATARQASEEAKLEAAKPIVSRFLDMENTKMSDKLLPVFMINGMIQYVVETITRLDPELAKQIQDDENMDENQESKFLRRVEQCRRKRDWSDLALMKKSYSAMSFFIRGDMYNDFILSNRHDLIVRELFKIFRPESNGNFHHFHKVFETILKRFRLQVTSMLFEDTDAETGQAKAPMIFDMLPYLDQPPVSLCLMKILFPTYTYGFADEIQGYYKTLQHGHFLEMLLAMVTLTENKDTNMGDLVVSLLDEATRAKDAKIFLSCLADDPIWAERLVRGIQSGNRIKRQSCIEITYSVLVRSIQMPFQDMFAGSILDSDKLFGRVESHLERIANDFGKNLSGFIPELCQEFVSSKSSGGQVSLPGFSVATSFTVGRLWLLDSIYHCLTDVKETPALLESIPEQFWITLVDSFFQYRFNSAFHVQFYKLFRVALHSEQLEVYDRFYVKTLIVKRMIEHYQAATGGAPTGTKGYIILILNCIRLSVEVEAQNGESSPPGFWTELLKESAEWNSFKDVLREATLEQTRDTLCHMDPNLRFQFAPLQARQASEAPMTKRHFGIPGVSARGTDGIDIGSRYANSLGFGVPMVYDSAQEEKEKEKEDQVLETEVYKALASMDWKLIPPQRVLNAMNNANSKAKAAVGTNNKAVGMKPSATSATSATSAATTTLIASNGKDSSSGQQRMSDSSAGIPSASSSSKSKKKKKNKKKRQIASVHPESSGGEEDDETEGMKRIAITSSEDESATDSDSSSGTLSNPSSANNSDVSEDEGGPSSSPKSNNITNGAMTPEEAEEERKQRRREKIREKRKKSRKNKKNKTGPGVDNRPDAEESMGDAMEH
ncbi:hypothetical protein BG004_000826 [Podila humilis]|nr:hypothetical protein BG004_000826 [Podila humilis]